MDQKSKVCVTGASGFVASCLVRRLLLSGYHVVGTVRDPGNERKTAHLRRLEGARERLSLVRADLLEEGSFDEAIKGCHGVFHTASPIMAFPSDPKVELVTPAVEGTLNVLRSCKKNPSLRRVILTSSTSAARIRDDFDPKTPLDESSWSSVELCETLQIWFAASKVLAEKAAWEFCKENQIDLVTVLPSFVVGPSLPPDMSSTVSYVLGLLKGETEMFKLFKRMGYVHVDDVALCHILVYENENASGRYICCSAVVNDDELASLLSTHYPSLPMPKRFDGSDKLLYHDFNTSKLKNLGFQFKSIPEMFGDSLASFVEKGQLGPI